MLCVFEFDASCGLFTFYTRKKNHADGYYALRNIGPLVTFGIISISYPSDYIDVSFLNYALL